jgi:hypothetical protein
MLSGIAISTSRQIEQSVPKTQIRHAQRSLADAYAHALNGGEDNNDVEYCIYVPARVCFTAEPIKVDISLWNQ